MGVVTAKEVLFSEEKNMDTLIRQAAKEIASEISSLSVVGQGVRYYSLNWKAAVSLDADRITVTYVDDEGNVTEHTFSHTLPAKDISPAKVNSPAKICMSKKLAGCNATITICKEGDACCSVSPSTCTFAG